MGHFYKSKKFYAAVIGAVVAFAKAYGMDIPEELLWVIISYIVGQGVADVGVYMAKEKKIGLALPQPTRVKTVTSSASPIIEMGATPPLMIKDDEIPPTTTATMLFKQEWSKPYVLTNPDNPAQVEVDFLGHYETVLELAKRMFEEQKGYYPENDIEDPCRTGDFSYPSKWLWHSQRELQIQKDMVAAIKKNPSMKFQLGGLGYLLQDIPWNEMPQWVRLSLVRHVQTK